MVFALCLSAGGDPDRSEARVREALALVVPHRRADVTRSGDLVAGESVVAHAGPRPGPDGPLGDKRPASQGGSGPLLVGHIRLARPDDLARRLDVAPAPDRALILQAHDRWGPAAGERLEGHYAFALWEPARRRLWAARDLWGTKPFFFREMPGALLCADSIEALLVMGGEPPDVDPTWIAEFLAGRRMSAERTPFVGIRRLPAGHALIARDGGLRVERQRTLWPLPTSGSDLATLTVEEAQVALREALDAAVGRALEHGPVGAMLSGGLDSGSLTVLAARRATSPLRTYSLVFPEDPAIDERRWIDAVLSRARVDPVAVRFGAGEAQVGLDLTPREHPIDSYGLGRLDRMMQAAAADGIRGLIDGHGGDEVVSAGVGRLWELAAEGRHFDLWRATRAAATHTGMTRTGMMRAALAAEAPSRLLRSVARRLGPRAAPGDRVLWRRMVREDVVRQTGLVERARTPPPDFDGATPEQARHLALLDPVGFADSFENLARLADRHGLEPRYPFFDERVVAICLTRPASEKLRDGQARAVLRGAMRGLLPDAVRLRVTKTDFAPVVRSELAQGQRGRLARLLALGDHPVWVYADTTAVRDAAADLGRGRAGPREVGQLWRVLSLAAWLDRLAAPAGWGDRT